MMKPLEAAQLAELQREFPIEEAPAKLTRAQKLERLATLVEQFGRYGCYLSLGHNLERYNDNRLSDMPVFGALELATRDEVFLKDGLTPGGSYAFSVKDVRDYLELSTSELHEFSCDCGGPISPEKMASRIRRLADSGPRPSIVAPSIVWRITNWRITNGLGLT
jgi:hypothetical protein